jgi:membrane protein DedA with SNARE-associated domain
VGATTLVAILLAGYAGGTLQFLLARGAFRRILVDVLVRLGLPRDRLEVLAERLRQRGARGVAVARATPGLRVGAIVACGLAALPLAVFIRGLVVGNAVFVGGHFALGFLIGPAAIGLIAGGSSAVIAILVVVVLAGAGAVGWSVLRRRHAVARLRDAATREGGSVGAVETEAGAFGSWADAACPACLTIAVVRSAQAAGRR